MISEKTEVVDLQLEDDDLRRASLVIDQVVDALARLTVRDCGSAGSLTLRQSLVRRGWSLVEDEHSAELLLAETTDDETVAAVIETDRPTLVAVRAVGASWPVWDPQLMSAGYAPCQAVGSWRFYVREDRGPAVGPLAARHIDAAELVAVAPGSPEHLLDQVVRWRTAALSRWAEMTGTEDAADGPQVEALRARLDAAVEELSAVRRTLSWRVTTPLRAVQRFRLDHSAR